jgi:outer membrane phospholipase A
MLSPMKILLPILLLTGFAAAQTEPSLRLGPPTPEDLITPTTQPSEPLNEESKVEAGLTEFLSTRFRPHEPMYFISGPTDPNTKFQFSLKYQIFSDHGQIDELAPWASNLYVAYSQTSFWDIGGESSPFFDSSYRPEFLFQLGPRRASWFDEIGMTRFDVQAGLKHESNGKDGLDSRSMNTVYISPILTFGDPGHDRLREQAGRSADDTFFVAVAPRVWAYVLDIDDTNQDIYHYRGYGDLRLVAGWRGGFQAAFIGRLGNDWDKGSLQVDLTYPLQKLAVRDLGMYLHAQLFTGYGESLLEYNESDTTFRMGLSLVR